MGAVTIYGNKYRFEGLKFQEGMEEKEWKYFEKWSVPIYLAEEDKLDD